MIIVCPNCSTSFIIPDQALGDEGRKVKCSKCQHVWHATKSNAKEKHYAEAPAVAVKAIPVNSALPAVAQEKFPVMALLSTIFLFILIMFTIFFFHSETLRNTEFGFNLLEKLRLHSTEGFVLKEIHVKSEIKAQKPSITLGYKIVNNSDFIQPMPLIRIRLLNETGKVLHSYIRTDSNYEFQPFSQLSPRTEFLDVSSDTRKVEIALGNRLELYHR